MGQLRSARPAGPMVPAPRQHPTPRSRRQALAGAIWAEQSWGRHRGWDPKETSAFLAWVADAAGHLHARATRGMRGRHAGRLAILACAVLMFTYYGVNLVISGLHGDA